MKDNIFIFRMEVQKEGMEL